MGKGLFLHCCRQDLVLTGYLPHFSPIHNTFLKSGYAPGHVLPQQKEEGVEQGHDDKKTNNNPGKLTGTPGGKDQIDKTGQDDNEYKLFNPVPQIIQ